MYAEYNEIVWASDRIVVIVGPLKQRVMPILATEAVVSACAITELMVSCIAIGAQLFPLDIG